MMACNRRARFVPARSPRGFTLTEMIIVIVIGSILAAVVAVFITSPVQGYLGSVERADLSDGADAALRRFAREVRLSLPNSLRVAPCTIGGVSNNCIEFILTSAGGRYRDASDGSTGGTILDFTDSSKLSFNVLGPMPSNPALATGASGDYVVVYNLGTGYSPADAYAAAAGNRAQVSGVAGNTITLASNPFAAATPTLPSPSNRFHVVPYSVRAVTYACPTTGATPGSFTRYWGYGFNPTQVLPTGGSTAVAFANVTCDVGYVDNAAVRNALLYIKLNVIDPGTGDTISVFQQIHVDNSP